MSYLDVARNDMSQQLQLPEGPVFNSIYRTGNAANPDDKAYISNIKISLL
jgi:hypothetical protein